MAIDGLLIGLIVVAMICGSILGFFAVKIWNKFKEIQIKRNAVKKIKKQDYQFTYDGKRITDFEDIKNNNINKDNNPKENANIGSMDQEEVIPIPPPDNLMKSNPIIFKPKFKPQHKFVKREK